MKPKVYLYVKENIDIKDLIKEIKSSFLIVKSIKEADVVILFGGDGTILKIVDDLVKYKKSVLTINFGKLGYLTSILKKDFLNVLDDLKNKRYEIERRKLLKIKYKNNIYYALNEAVFLRSNIISNLILVQINDVTKDRTLINTYRADGIIVSSPTGSTAYSLSAGGPIIHKNMNAMCITAISPQTLSNRPIVLDGKTKLELKMLSENISFQYDGHNLIDLKKDEVVNISISKKQLEFISFNNNSYYETLRNKLKWDQHLLDLGVIND